MWRKNQKTGKGLVNMNKDDLIVYYTQRELLGDTEYSLEDIKLMLESKVYEGLTWGLNQVMFLTMKNIFGIFGRLYYEEESENEEYKEFKGGKEYREEEGVYDYKDDVWRSYLITYNYESVNKLLQVEKKDFEYFFRYYIVEKKKSIDNKYDKSFNNKEDLDEEWTGILVSTYQFEVSNMLDSNAHQLLNFYIGKDYQRYTDRIYELTRELNKKLNDMELNMKDKDKENSLETFKRRMSYWNSEGNGRARVRDIQKENFI